MSAPIILDNSSNDIVLESKDNILTSYSAEDKDHPDWFIYEYTSGRRVLVELNSESGKVHFLKEL